MNEVGRSLLFSQPSPCMGQCLALKEGLASLLVLSGLRSSRETPGSAPNTLKQHSTLHAGDTQPPPKVPQMQLKTTSQDDHQYTHNKVPKHDHHTRHACQCILLECPKHQPHLYVEMGTLTRPSDVILVDSSLVSNPHHMPTRELA